MLVKIQNQIFSPLLSLLVFASILHIDPYHNSNYDKYNLCSTHCDEEEHNSKTHECNKIHHNDKKSHLIHQSVC